MCNKAHTCIPQHKTTIDPAVLHNHKAGLPDLIHVKFARHFCLITEYDCVIGNHKLLEVM